MSTYRDGTDFLVPSSRSNATQVASRWTPAGVVTMFPGEGTDISGSLHPSLLVAMPYLVGANTQTIVRMGLEVTVAGSQAVLGIYTVGCAAYPLPSSVAVTVQISVNQNTTLSAASITATNLLPDTLYWATAWAVSSVTIARVGALQLPPIFGYDINSGSAIGVVVASWGTATMPTAFPGSYSLTDSPNPSIGLLLG